MYFSGRERRLRKEVIVERSASGKMAHNTWDQEIGDSWEEVMGEPKPGEVVRVG